MRKAVVRETLVENIVEWDASSTWAPPNGTTLVNATSATEVGGGWDGSTFTPKPAYVPTVEENNKVTIEDRALTALDTNRTYIALSSPTAAQNIAQAKALSRQVNGLIRVLLNKLDGTD